MNASDVVSIFFPYIVSHGGGNCAKRKSKAIIAREESALQCENSDQ